MIKTVIRLMLTLALCGIPHLFGGILYSNVSGGFPGPAALPWGAGGVGLIATTFITCAAGNLASIVTAVAQLDPQAPPLTAGLYQDSSGKPGQLLESWSIAAATGNGSSVPPLSTLTSAQNLFLSSETRYWFVVSSATANQVDWLRNDSGVSGGLWQIAGGLNHLNNLVLAFPGVTAPGIQLNSIQTQPAIRTGVFPHIAAGGGWSTVMTLVNTSAAAISANVAFYKEDGTSWSLPVTATIQGATQPSGPGTVSATIAPNSTLIVNTGDQASTSVGWADVVSTNPVGGYAIFRYTPQSGPPSEGTVPLLTQFPPAFVLPFDNTNGFVMGVALANLSVSVGPVTATAWDANGKPLGMQVFTIPGNGHTSFDLPTAIPLTAGSTGVVQFRGSVLGGLGLRFSPFGTFTDVPILAPSPSFFLGN